MDYYSPEVKLLSVTEPFVDSPGTVGEYIAYCARVSNPGNQHNNETSSKLLKYLIDNHHWSPFEMAHMTLSIKTTRDISRQMLRHRSFSFQEFSQRYAEVEHKPVFREPRMQDHDNRQNSLHCSETSTKTLWLASNAEVSDKAVSSYKEACEMGIAKEQARALLPEGLTETTVYMSGTIRSWVHYVKERTSNGTQKEHRQVAEKCKEFLLKVVPELVFAME